MIENLKQKYILKPVEIFKCLTSKDGTKKYLLKLSDDNIVECVFLHQSYGNTICLSSQRSNALLTTALASSIRFSASLT